MYHRIRSTIKSILPPQLVISLRNVREVVNVRSKYLYGTDVAWRRWVDAARLWTRPAKTVLFHPDCPVWVSEYVAFRLCALLRYKVINDPRQHYDVAFKFHDSTLSTPEDLAAEDVDLDRAVNGKSRDISKSTIETIFASVFGYELRVDPTQYEGAAVVKSDKNYTHDGRVIECPIDESEVERGSVYQKEIDTKTESGYFLDHRVVIIGDTIPLVYLKYQRTRFENTGVSHIELVRPEDVFEPLEMKRLFELARAMGLDYGELDVLRNRSDGRIYVVDVANTPTGPSYGITKEQQRRALNIMLPPFEDLIKQFS